MTEPERAADAAREVRVWDPFVRIFHWSLAAAFFVAYFTEDETMALHVWAGYAVGGLVAARIVWGFVGTRHARFSDFLFGPVAGFRYLTDLLRFRARRYLGHSPAGAAMAYVLLIGCLALVGTGLAAWGAEGNGPLKGYMAEAERPTVAFTTEARADEDEDEEDRNERNGGEAWEEAHEFLSGLVFAAVLLHIGGVLLASIAHGENLTRAMITGRKRAQADEPGQ